MDLVRLKIAAEELRFLLARGYPRRPSLELAGNRHDLDALARAALARAIMSPRLAGARRAKLLRLTDLAGRSLALDGHNVLITLESALAGRSLVKSDDGVIRDLAKAARSYCLSPLTESALDLILGALKSLCNPPAEVKVFLDAPVSQSGRLAERITERLAAEGLCVQARAVAVPERFLVTFPGIVASGDGEVIDRCPEPLDLAGAIIQDGNFRLEEDALIDLST